MLSDIETANEVIAGSGYGGDSTTSRRIRVVLFDLLPTVPYYTGHLTAALGVLENLDVTLRAATYTHDHTFFQRMGLRNRPGFLDLAYRVRVTRLRRPIKLIECLLNMAALSLQFVRSKPDILHVQFTPLAEHRMPFEMWFLKLARAMGIRLVYTVHNVLPHGASNHQVSVCRRLYVRVHQLICHDTHAKARLVSEFGIDPGRISVIPHGPLFAGDGNQKPEYSLSPKHSPSGDCMVLCQGIIRPYKGIPFLLRVWKAARDAGLKGSLWIVGTGDKDVLKQIREQAALLGIESSVFFDFRFVTVQELAGYFEAADILVYPYYQVTTSGALMTGVVYGKPIIASTLPSFEHVLRNGRNALLASYGDIDAWRSALLTLASDPVLRSRLSRELTDGRVLSPSWDEIASQTRGVYEGLLVADAL